MHFEYFKKEFENLEKGYKVHDLNRSLSSWVPSLAIKTQRGTPICQIDGFPNNCGCCIISNYSFSGFGSFLEILPSIEKALKKGLIGAIITVHGANGFLESQYRDLKKAGFEVVKTYKNLTHGETSSDKQGLLIKNLCADVSK